MKKKVLILGVAAVQMDAIVELKKMGFEVHACAMAKDGPGVEAADIFIEINILDTESVTNYIRENGISIVYSVGSDIAMPVASKISEQLNIPYFVSEETATICNNKDLMRKTLGNTFIGNVKFQVLESGNENLELEYPFIMKPADSQGQRGVKLIYSYEEYLQSFEFTKEFSRSGLVILEQYISGPEISVNGYLIDGHLKFIVASDRETWPEYTGLIHKHIVPSKNLNNNTFEQTKEIIELASNKLNIRNGPVYVQMKLENDSPYIIEITPRLDGCHMWNILNRYTEINLLRLTFEHLLFNKVSIIDNYRISEKSYALEFMSQEPNTPAEYSTYSESITQSLESFKYYSEGQNIRPVNGKYEKIGYSIFRNENAL